VPLHNSMKRPEQSRRAQEIEELEAKLKAIAGGNAVIGRSEDFPDELHKRFLASVLAFETAPEEVPFDLLTKSGVSLPPPANVPDGKIHAQLHDVIDAMSLLGMYLQNTDHLSDRELYRLLWEKVLREPTVLMPNVKDLACHIDLVGSGSEEDIRLYLKYYADEDYRGDWHERWPEDELPPHEDPPFNRDRDLPAPRGWRVV